MSDNQQPRVGDPQYGVDPAEIAKQKADNAYVDKKTLPKDSSGEWNTYLDPSRYEKRKALKLRPFEDGRLPPGFTPPPVRPPETTQKRTDPKVRRSAFQSNNDKRGLS